MDKFQIYDRKNNTWVENDIVISGWEEHFVQDKTTDYASIKLKYRNLTKPTWEIGDWCRMLHLGENETGATYDYVIVAGDTVLSSSLFDFEFFPNYRDTGNVAIRFSTHPQHIDIIYTVNVIYEINSVRYTDEYEYNAKNGFFDKVYQYSNDEFTLIDVKVIGVSKIYYTYNGGSKYIPKNHEQYIIKNITLVEDVINGEWDCQLDLQEPIEITKGIQCETMSYTNQTEKTIDNINYIHDSLNHLSVLQKILKVTPANNDINKSWYSRIKIGSFRLLEQTPFNNDTFNEPSLYNILMDNYDSSLGRTPVLYFDIDVTTDLPTNRKKATYVLDFLRQDGFDKNEIAMSSLLENRYQCIINKSEDNFSQGLISNFDNLISNTRAITPADIIWAVPEVDTNNRLLTGYTKSNSQAGDWILKLPHKIKKIISAKSFYLYQNVNINTTAITITPVKTNNYNGRIFEEKQYKASSDTYYQQRNCIWYTEGSNIIHLNEAYYSTGAGATGFDQQTKLWVFRINYEPLISARFDLGKDYQTPINQVNSQIDSQKFGRYLEDYLASMDKADMLIQKTVSDWAEIEELGSKVVDNDKEYLITNVGIKNRGFDYDVVYQLNENHFRKNDSIQAPQEIRKNIAIEIEATKERKSMLVFNCGLSKDLQQSEFYNTPLMQNGMNNILKQMFAILNWRNSSYAVDYIQLAYLKIRSLLITENAENTNFEIERLCNIARFYMNNTFCLNLTYLDNAEAGKQKQLSTRQPYSDLTIYGMPRSQVPVLYTDGFGEFESFDVKLLDISNGVDISDLTVGSTRAEKIEYIRNVSSVLTPMAEYPLTSSIASEDIETPIAEINGINYYKDMLDKFNYTLAFHCNLDKSIILCDGFFNYNILMRNAGRDMSNGYIKAYTTNLKEQDIPLYTGVKNRITGLSISTESVDNISVTKRIYTLTRNIGSGIKSLVLFDSVDVPIMIINNNTETGNTFTIYHS